MNFRIAIVILSFFNFQHPISSQEKETFSDEQFKLSIGPLRGQPDYFEDFEWSKGFGAAIEYNNHFSKKFSWGCEIGFTYDYEYFEPDRYLFYSTYDSTINLGNVDRYHNYMRTQYSIIPQISFHIINRNKLNLTFTGGFGLFSQKCSRFTITPNTLVVGSISSSFYELLFVGNFALSVDYKISPRVFAGVKVQDHIFLDSEFRSLRASIGYIID